MANLKRVLRRRFLRRRATAPQLAAPGLAGLGEVLPLAAAAALVAPCDLETLDALRRGLTPHLPFLRLQRILQLRGVVPDPSGWAFTPELCQALVSRVDEARRREVLRWYLERLDAGRVRRPGGWVARERSLVSLWLSADPEAGARELLRDADPELSSRLEERFQTVMSLLPRPVPGVASDDPDTPRSRDVSLGPGPQYGDSHGMSLAHLLLRFHKGLPPAVALEVVRLASLALQFAWEAPPGSDGLRLLDRQIWPSHLMLSVHGEVIVLEFAEPGWSQRGQHTVALSFEPLALRARSYTPPELLDGMPGAPAVDVFTAGVTLYELLTGERMTLPVDPKTHNETLAGHLSDLSFIGLDARALERLRKLIRRMCAYGATDRPALTEVAVELEHAIAELDPGHRTSLADYARRTVLPLYDRLTRVGVVDDNPS